MSGSAPIAAATTTVAAWGVAVPWKCPGRSCSARSSFCSGPRSSLACGSPVTDSVTLGRDRCDCRYSHRSGRSYHRSRLYMMPEGPEVRSLVDRLSLGAVGWKLGGLAFRSGRYYPYNNHNHNNHNNTTNDDKNDNHQTNNDEKEKNEHTKETSAKGPRPARQPPDGLFSFVQTLSSSSLPLPLRPNVSLTTFLGTNVSTPLPPSRKRGYDPARRQDTIREWNCKGKFMYLLLCDDDDDDDHKDDENDDDYQRSIWITLGLTGRFVSQADHAAQQNSSSSSSSLARWYMELYRLKEDDNNNDNDDNDNNNDSNPTTDPMIVTKRIYYYDQRNFGTLKFCLSRQELMNKLSSLGPDILQLETTTVDALVTILQAQRPTLNICRLLMDQSKISGIGNYLLAEGLYRANIDPFCTVNELTLDEQRLLCHELQSTAWESYRAQAYHLPSTITTTLPDDDTAVPVFAFQCYGRTTCARRGDPVIRDTHGPHGRPIWYTERQLLVSRPDRALGKTRLPHAAAETNVSGSRSLTWRAANVGIQGDKALTDSVDGEENWDMDRAAQYRLSRHLRDRSWREELDHAMTTPSFWELASFLEEERARATVYPPTEETFQALNLCPFDNVKVVIVGQDPYHTPKKAHGLAFSVRKGEPLPPSLKNILQEVMNDVGIDHPTHGNLEHWARQGVLLLNTVLTVRQGEPTSHVKKGWEEFTDVVIQKLVERRDGLVFLLWGNDAAKKASIVNETIHRVIRTSHPSPLGATKTKSPFLGSRCFSRTNQALVEAGHEPIDWNL